jgi:hypothetical protein
MAMPGRCPGGPIAAQHGYSVIATVEKQAARMTSWRGTPGVRLKEAEPPGSPRARRFDPIDLAPSVFVDEQSGTDHLAVLILHAGIEIGQPFLNHPEQPPRSMGFTGVQESRPGPDDHLILHDAPVVRGERSNVGECRQQLGAHRGRPLLVLRRLAIGEVGGVVVA